MSDRDLAYEDELTGAYNRRFLTHLFDEGWDELRRNHDVLSIIIVDLDAFKEINDTHGHATGDEALRTTAAVLRDCFRKDDIIVRYGGDEFVVVLPGVRAEEAAQIAERARVSARHRRLDSSAAGVVLESVIAFSVGIASYPSDGSTGETVLEIADRRLYTDKRSRQRRALVVRQALPALAVSIAAVVLAVVLYSGRTKTSLGLPLEVPSPTPQQVRSSADWAEAQARIVEMEREIQQLSAKLSEQQHEDVRGDYQDKIAKYERLVGELRQQQASTKLSSSPAVAPTPRVVSTAPTAAPTPSRSDGNKTTTPRSTASSEIVESPDIELRDPPAASSRTVSDVLLAEIVLPRLRVEVRPQYPSLGRRLKREAVVAIRVVIDAEGRVKEAEPHGATVGFGFEREALAAVRKSRFEPGLKDGVATEMEIVMTFRFVLDAHD